MLSPEERLINEEIFERLSDPTVAQRAVEALSDYTRAQIREAEDLRPRLQALFAALDQATARARLDSGR